MMTILKFRNILKDKSESLTDSEVEQIINQIYELTELIFEMWIKEKPEK